MIILKVTLRLYSLCSDRRATAGTMTFVEPCSIPDKKKICWLKAAPAIVVVCAATKSKGCCYPKSRFQKVHQFPCVHLLTVAMLMFWGLAFCVSSLLCLVVFPSILISVRVDVGIVLLRLTFHHCQNTWCVRRSFWPPVKFFIEKQIFQQIGACWSGFWSYLCWSIFRALILYHS